MSENAIQDYKGLRQAVRVADYDWGMARNAEDDALIAKQAAEKRWREACQDKEAAWERLQVADMALAKALKKE